MSFSSHDSRSTRVNHILADYLESRERSKCLDTDALLRQYPELADELREFFDNYHDLFGGPSPAPPSTVTESRTPSFSVGSATSALPIPRMFGEFELLEEIARGGMGIVYRAWQRPLQRVVAVKVLRGGAMGSIDDLQRFKIETNAAGRLTHPRIVPIYEVGEEEGIPYFAMAFIPGESLAAKIARGPLLPREAARIVQHAAEAMSFAHHQGVIHRDLKPANILLDPQGQVYVTDFGLARSTWDSHHPTQQGQILGTPQYMPPEQVRGNDAASTPTTDVYALGATLYAAITGRPPFQAATPLATLKQVLDQPAVAPRLLDRSIPRDVDTITLKCLEKEPTRRYPSAQELADDLQRFLEDEPIRARPVSLNEHLLRWCRRHRSLTFAMISATITCVVALALAVQTSVTRNLRREHSSTEAALREAQTQRMRADAFRDQAERAAHDLTVERSLQLCQQHDPARGLLQMVQLLHTLQTQGRSDSLMAEALEYNLRSWSDELWPLQAICNHSSEVQSIAFVDDSSTIVTGDQHGHVQLWHVGDSTVPQPRGDCGAPVLALHTHQDSSPFLVLDGRRDLRCLPDTTPVAMAPTIPQTQRIPAAEFNSDGSQIAVAQRDGTIIVCDTTTGTLITSVIDHGTATVVRGIAWSGPADLFSISGHTLYHWHIPAADDPVAQERVHVPSAAVAACRARGLVATGGVDGRVDIWRADGRFTRKMSIETNQSVSALRFSEDGRLLAVGSTSGHVQVWSVDEGRTVSPQLAHGAEITCMRFHSDNHLLATASEDRTVRVWQVPARILRDPNTTPSEAAAGRYAVSEAERFAHFGKTWARDQIGYGIAVFSPDGNRVLRGHIARGVATASVEATRSQPEPSLTTLPGTIVDLDAHPAQPWAALADDSGSVVGISWQNGETLWEATQRTASPRAVQFLADGHHLAISYRDGALIVWNTDTRMPHRIREPSADPIEVLTTIPQRHWLVGGTQSGAIECWDTFTGRLVYRESLFSQTAITAVAATCDGERLAVASGADQVVQWHCDRRATTGATIDCGQVIIGLCYNADGSILLTSGISGPARFWDPQGASVGNPLEHDDVIFCAAFHPTLPVVATASKDQSMQLWHVPTGLPIGPSVQRNHEVHDLRFSVDGTAIRTLTLEGDVQDTPLPAKSKHSPSVWQQALESATGLQLDEHGVAKTLDGATWERRESGHAAAR